jgi:hypothetical protein
MLIGLDVNVVSLVSPTAIVDVDNHVNILVHANKLFLKYLNVPATETVHLAVHAHALHKKMENASANAIAPSQCHQFSYLVRQILPPYVQQDVSRYVTENAAGANVNVLAHHLKCQVHQNHVTVACCSENHVMPRAINKTTVVAPPKYIVQS